MIVSSIIFLWDCICTHSTKKSIIFGLEQYWNKHFLSTQSLFKCNKNWDLHFRSLSASTAEFLVSWHPAGSY